MKFFNLLTTFLCFLMLSDCGDKNVPTREPEKPPVDHPKPVDPETAATVGFFMDEWKNKIFEPPQTSPGLVPSAAANITVDIDASKVIAKIPYTLFGHNSVSYRENISSQEPIITHIKNLGASVIRFPGGSISDSYFWNRNFQDKPAGAPDSIVKEDGSKALWRWNYWYGKNNPAERANLDDYYSLLQKTGSQGILTVNYGYARYGISQDPVAEAAHLAADWVRYDNGRTKYWEIGNENHGGWEMGYRINTWRNKDGQPEFITGRLYGQHAAVFIDSMKKAAAEIGKKIYIGVGVIEAYNSWLWQASKAAAEWNSGVMTMAGHKADFYVVHSYYVNNSENTFTQIVSSATEKTGAMVKYVKDEATKNGVPVKPVALTEYNIFATGDAGSMQQVSIADAMHNLLVVLEGIKNNFGAAVRWDFVSGWAGGADHGMFDLGDEPEGTKWNPRPSFYYYYFLQKFFGDRMLESAPTNSGLLAYASSFNSGEKAVVLINKSVSTQIVKVNLKNTDYGNQYYWYTLRGGSDNGDFSRKVYINNIGPQGAATGGPANEYTTIKAFTANAAEGIKVSVPEKGVIFLAISKK